MLVLQHLDIEGKVYCFIALIHQKKTSSSNTPERKLQKRSIKLLKMKSED